MNLTLPFKAPSIIKKNVINMGETVDVKITTFLGLNGIGILYIYILYKIIKILDKIILDNKNFR